MPAKSTGESKPAHWMGRMIKRMFSPKRDVDASMHQATAHSQANASIYQAAEHLNAFLPTLNTTATPAVPLLSSVPQPTIHAVLATIDEDGDDKSQSGVVSLNEKARRRPPATAPLSPTGPYDKYVPHLVYLQTTQIVGCLSDAPNPPSLHKDLRAARFHDKTPAPVGAEGKLVVLKMFVAQESGSNSTGREDVMMAATAHPDGHPNVIAYFGNTHFAPNAGSPVARWMVMEYFECGTLLAMIADAEKEYEDEQTTTTLPKGLCRRLLGDVLKGLHFLHVEKNIVHGDMKADNVLVKHRGDNMSICAVISDFGLSRYCSSEPRPDSDASYITSNNVRSRGHKACVSVETLNWSIRLPDMTPLNPTLPSAPEPSSQQRARPSNVTTCISKEKPSDIWSLGVLMLHVMAYHIPWASGDIEELARRITAGIRPPFPPDQTLARGLDFANWRIMWECWAALPRHRPTIQVLDQMWDPEQPEHPVDLRLLSSDNGPSGWPDLTTEISAPLRKASTTSHRGDYIVISGMLWRPSEIGEQFVNVQLVRRDGLLDSDGWNEDFRTELAKCRQVRHQRLHAPIGIGRLKGSGAWFAVFALVDDYADWLADEQRREKKDGSFILILSALGMIREVAEALKYLHMQNPPIVHGDVVLSNVLFPPSESDLRKLSPSQQPNALLGGYLNMHLASNDIEIQSQELAADIRAFRLLIRQVLEPLINALKESHADAGDLLGEMSEHYDDLVSDDDAGSVNSSATAIMFTHSLLVGKVQEVLDSHDP